MADLTKKELSETLSGLSPVWFSLVMATGIVGIAAYMQGIPFAPTFLMWANIIFYALLWLVYLARLVAFPRAFLGNFRQHMSAMGYFTIVAGTGVLGSQILQVGNYQTVAQILWVVALLFWLLLVYAIPIALIAQSEGKPQFEEGIQGNWLLWTVGTASVSVLGTQLAYSFGSAANQVVFWSFLIWLLSVVFYVWVIVMIVQRLFFYHLTANELYPTYWIDMGAVAIVTLAGATLLRTQAQPPLIERLEPFVTGLTLVFWITATWWIPWLFVMFVWRHAILRQPVWFMPGWWGMVFPLGMYSTATATVARALDVPVFDRIATVFVWLSLAAWIVTFVNMLVTLWRWPLNSGST